VTEAVGEALRMMLRKGRTRPQPGGFLLVPDGRATRPKHRGDCRQVAWGQRKDPRRTRGGNSAVVDAVASVVGREVRLLQGHLRTAELTVAILQLVASGRGICALPSWTVGNYIERGYVVSRAIGEHGLFCELYAATSRSAANASYINEFVELTRKQSLNELRGVSAL